MSRFSWVESLRAETPPAGAGAGMAGTDLRGAREGRRRVLTCPREGSGLVLGRSGLRQGGAYPPQALWLQQGLPGLGRGEDALSEWAG